MTLRTRSGRAAVALACVLGAVAAADTTPVIAAAALPVPVGGFHDGVYVPIDDVPLGDSGVVANGNLALSWAGSQFEANLDDENQLASSRSDVGLRGAVTLELAAEASTDFDETLEILTLPLTPFEAGPLTITPYLGVTVRISGDAEAGAQVSVVAPFDVSAILSSLGQQRDASAETAPSFRPEIGLPDAANALALHATVELELTTTFMILVGNVVPIGGPVIAAALGAELDVDLGGRGPWWDLDAITGLKYGWSMPDALGAPQPAGRLRPLFDPLTVDIDSADDAAPLADVSTRWSHAFDSHNDDDAGAVIPAGEELVVVEQSGTPWMATLDGFGNPRWQLNGTEPMSGEAVARTDAGDLVVAGVKGSGDVRVERYDSVGTPQWARIVEIDDVVSGKWTAVVPRAEGAVVAGNVTHRTGERRAILAELDETGDLVWATEIDTGLGSSQAAITALAEVPNGELLAVGAVDYTDSDGTITGHNALVLRMAADGTPVAAYALGAPLGEDATGVAVHDDGSYAISGQTSAAGDDHFSWVASFGADDTLLWSSTYADRPDAGYASANGIAAVADGGYVVAGWTGMRDEDGWLIRLDGTGMPLWSKTYEGTDDNELTGVVAMPIGVAACGQTNTTNALGNSFNDIWLLRTNVDGMAHFDPGTGFDTINHPVQWHPSAEYTLHQLDPAKVATTVNVIEADAGATPANATTIAITS